MVMASVPPTCRSITGDSTVQVATLEQAFAQHAPVAEEQGWRHGGPPVERVTNRPTCLWGLASVKSVPVLAKDGGGGVWWSPATRIDDSPIVTSYTWRHRLSRRT